LNSNPNIPGAGRTKLYILPIGEFEKRIAPDLEKLKEYTAAYYHPMPVERKRGPYRLPVFLRCIA
jgi:hypothetical protein